MNENGKNKSKKSIIYVCVALALVLVAVVSLFIGGVFGAEQSAPPENENASALAAAAYLCGDYAQIDENGKVYSNEEVFVLRLAESIKGEAVTSVSEGCLMGCEKISAVIIPVGITEIGANAFADCPNLKAIIFEGRADLSGVTLGENWNGGTEILFELTAPAPDTDTVPEATPDTSTPNSAPEATPVATANAPANAPADAPAPIEQSEPTEQPIG